MDVVASVPLLRTSGPGPRIAMCSSGIGRGRAERKGRAGRAAGVTKVGLVGAVGKLGGWRASTNK